MPPPRWLPTGRARRRRRRSAIIEPAASMRDRLPTISPRTYARVSVVALAALSLIVLTGAGVRLTGSGLGCPDWPKCYGQAVAPLETHAIIEYGNRLLSGLVGLAAVGAGALAYRPGPFR